MTIGNSPIKARDGHGRAIRSLETVAQDQRAAELRSASLTYAQIGEQLGISVTAAYESVQRGFVLVPTEDVVAAKAAELAKLDRIERHLLGVMTREHVRVDHGHVVMDEGRPVLDDGPGVQAALGLLRVQERRARLCGLDEPAKFRVGVVTEDMVDAEIRRLEEKLASEIEAPPHSRE
jgi:hypothetical protein